MSSLTASPTRFKRSIFFDFQRAKSSANYRKRLAIHYLECKGHTLNRRDQKAFSELVRQLYQEVPFPVEYAAGQPYKTANQMSEDVRQINQNAIAFPQNSVIVPPILEIIQFSSPNIGCCESCITIPFPQQYSNQIQGLSSDVADSLGGATVLPNFLGWWKNQNGEIIADQLVAIKSFTQVKNLVNNWEKLLASIHYWGKMSQQEEIAIELSVFALGSVLLLVSIES